MKKSIFAKLLIVVLCLSLVLCGCASSGNTDVDDGGKGENKPNVETVTPEQIAEEALAKTMSAIFGDMGFVESDSDYGKITLSVGEYVNNVMYIDGKDMQVADELSLNIDGMQMELGIYANDEELVLTMPDVLDDAYGISYETLLQDLENSELWTLLGVDYDEVKSEIEPMLEDLLKQDADDSVEEMEQLIEDVLSSVDRKVTEGKVTVDGETVDAVIVTYSMDQDDMLKMLDSFCVWYEKYMESFAALDIEEAMDEFDDAVAEVETALKEADLTVELVVNINAETGYIMTAKGVLEGTVEDEEGTAILELDLGLDASKSDKFTLKATEIADGEEMDVFQVILKRDIADAEVAYELSVRAAGMTVFRMDLTYDKDTNAYGIEMEMDEEKFSANGTFEATDSKLALTVDTLTSYGEETELNLELILENITAEDIPAMPKYKNILKLTQDDLIDVITKLGETFGGASAEPDIDLDDYEVVFPA